MTLGRKLTSVGAILTLLFVMIGVAVYLYIRTTSDTAPLANQTDEGEGNGTLGTVTHPIEREPTQDEIRAQELAKKEAGAKARQRQIEALTNNYHDLVHFTMEMEEKRIADAFADSTSRDVYKNMIATWPLTGPRLAGVSGQHLVFHAIHGMEGNVPLTAYVYDTSVKTLREVPFLYQSRLSSYSPNFTYVVAVHDIFGSSENPDRLVIYNLLTQSTTTELAFTHPEKLITDCGMGCSTSIEWEGERAVRIGTYKDEGSNVFTPLRTVRYDLIIDTWSDVDL